MKDYITKEELGIDKSTDYYEKEIINTCLFDLDKEREYVAYRSEAMKLTETLYKYVVSTNPTEYREYGSEIFEVIMDCIKAFDKSKGRFINYFNHSWSNRKKKIFIEKEYEEKYHSLEISDEIKDNVRKFIKYAQSKDVDLRDKLTINKIAQALNIQEKKVIQYIEISQVNVTTDVVYFDGEEFSLFEQIKGNTNIEEELLENEQIRNMLSKIDSAFISAQDRQKSILSDMLTIKICKELPNIEEYIDRYSFFSKFIYENFVKEEKVLSQRDIAEKYNKNEASISRMFRKFVRKIV